MANTDKKGAGQAAGSSNETARKGSERPGEKAKPSGDSPKRQGDPLLHVIKDKEG